MIRSRFIESQENPLIGFLESNRTLKKEYQGKFMKPLNLETNDSSYAYFFIDLFYALNIWM